MVGVSGDVFPYHFLFMTILRHGIQGNQKLAKKEELHYRSGADKKYCGVVFFDMANDSLASSLTPLQRNAVQEPLDIFEVHLQ